MAKEKQQQPETDEQEAYVWNAQTAESAAAPAAVTTATAPPAETAEKFCVYLGPTVAGRIQNGAVYPGARAAALSRLADALAKHPEIAGLLVTDKTLARDRARIKTPGNALYVRYQRFAARLKKGG